MRQLWKVAAVRQEDVADAAQLLEAAHKEGQVLGRIDEPVAVGMPNEVAVASEGLRRVEAAVRHTVFERQWEILLDSAGVVASRSADGTRRTGEQGARRVTTLGFGLGLRVHGRVFAEVGEGLRRQLATGVAVDAGGIDEELAVGIVGQPLLGVGHVSPSLLGVLVLALLLGYAVRYVPRIFLRRPVDCLTIRSKINYPSPHLRSA